MKDDIDIFDLLSFALIVGGAITIVIFMTAVVDVRAIEAGLQQCVVENRTVWQKECGK